MMMFTRPQETMMLYEIHLRLSPTHADHNDSHSMSILMDTHMFSEIVYALLLIDEDLVPTFWVKISFKTDISNVIYIKVFL